MGIRINQINIVISQQIYNVILSLHLIEKMGNFLVKVTQIIIRYSVHNFNDNIFSGTEYILANLYKFRFHMVFKNC